MHFIVFFAKLIFVKIIKFCRTHRLVWSNVLTHEKYIAYTLLFSFSLLLFSCNKEAENRWNVEIKTTEPVKITDISAAFYNDKIPFQNFKKDFGFFLGTTSSRCYLREKRSDAIEKRVYKDALNKIIWRI